MTIIKTSELTGATLDWAVAKCEGAPEYVLNKPWRASELIEPYSTYWAVGGPIIEQMGDYCQEGDKAKGHYSCSTPSVAQDWHTHPVKATGPTPLIAAMRCYVASKLGYTVDVPEELTK